MAGNKGAIMLTMKQQLYKKYRLEGMCKAAAALAAGYSHATAYHHTSKIEAGVKLAHFIESRGLHDRAIAQHVHDGLMATKIIGYLHTYKKDEDGRVEKISPDEVVSNEFIEVPDWSARHKYLETILEVMGKTSKAPIVEQHNHFVFFNDIVKKSRELCPSLNR